MQTALEHHIWANSVLLDVCESLDDERLRKPVPTIYGSIIDTMRHVFEADQSYLHALTGGAVTPRDIDADSLSLADLRRLAEAHAEAWRNLIARAPDETVDVASASSLGGTRHATMGVRIAQAIHHGTDHRSQVCTALTSVGVEPPDIDVWSYGESAGLASYDPAG
jgi:uncharacterized damage-inducible protein DinB